jgi:hypothetical protein
MFPENCHVFRSQLSAETVKQYFKDEKIIFVGNPTHKPTIDAFKKIVGVEVEIPVVAPKVSLHMGDKFIVMQVQGLPRLGGDRVEYTQQEIDQATFKFGIWFV